MQPGSDDAPAPLGSAGPPAPVSQSAARTRRETRSGAPAGERGGAIPMLQAFTRVASELEPDAVLRNTVDIALEVLGARTAVLGILGGGGECYPLCLTRKAGERTATIHDDPAAVDEPLLHPQVIERLVGAGCAQRLPDPRARGAAGDHPILGAPILVDGKVMGILCVADRLDNRPMGRQDEAALQVVADAAGPALHNAQVFTAARQAALWTEAVGDLTQTLLEGRREDTALTRMVKRARTLGGAALSMVAMRTHTGRLVVDAADPSTGPRVIGRYLTGRNWDRALRLRAPLTLMEMPGDERVGELLSEIHALSGYETPLTAVLAPLAVGEEELGIMCLVWPSTHRHLAIETTRTLPGFADRMALAIEAGRAGRQRARARLLEERERIARDMHDHVIQRLFAAGLSLQIAARRSDGPERARIDDVIEELNTTAGVLRHAITGLHTHPPDGGLGPGIENLIHTAADAAGYLPGLSIDGHLSDIPAEIENDILAVIREGLSNITRHSGATDASVAIKVTDEILITIEDNGTGIPDDAPVSGLANLRRRAHTHRGVFTTDNRSPSGTRLRWRVPLPIDRSGHSRT